MTGSVPGPVRRLHHVQVGCPAGGEDSVRAFYSGLLGLTEVPKPAELKKRGGVWFRGAGYELHVGVETPFVPASRAHPAFLVDDLDGIAATATANGREVTWNGDLIGYRRFYTRDPHGNRVELLTPACSDQG